MNNLSKILLFDIDWTLLRGTGKVFVNGHREALENILGITLKDDFDITPHEGKTGSRFFIDIAEERGVDRAVTREALPQLAQYLATFCEEHRDELGVERLPHVQEALEGLGAGFGLGILTGNFRDVALLKLRLAELEHYFAFGAYGDISEIRSDLVEHALSQAGELYEQDFLPSDAILIGDNTRDIACGLEAGVYTVGVATGPVNEIALRQSGAHVILPSLAEWRRIVNFADDPEGTYETRIRTGRRSERS